MMIYVVTYCPIYAEYSNQRSLRKAFTSESAAKHYIESEKQRELNKAGGSGWMGDYDYDEIELDESV